VDGVHGMLGRVIKILETRKDTGRAIILHLIMVDSHALVVAVKWGLVWVSSLMTLLRLISCCNIILVCSKLWVEFVELMDM
jgi:hypothetical protein